MYGSWANLSPAWGGLWRSGLEDGAIIVKSVAQIDKHPLLTNDNWKSLKAQLWVFSNDSNTDKAWRVDQINSVGLVRTDPGNSSTL